MNARVPAAFELPPGVVDRVISLALDEDLASGDVTTEACVDAGTGAVAHAVAREATVACGGAALLLVLAPVDSARPVQAPVQAGARARVRALPRSLRRQGLPGVI